MITITSVKFWVDLLSLENAIITIHNIYTLPVRWPSG